LESSRKSLVADLRHVLAPQFLNRAREVAAQMSTPHESVSRAVDLLADSAQ
jgi:UDP:flavonoid glycosyltransferase YjiC (YdhE family)